MKFFGGFYGIAFDVWIDVSKTPCCAHNGSTGSYSRDEMGDPAFRLLPYFLGGGLKVGLPVGVIVVMVGHEIQIGIFVVDFTCQPNGAV